MTMTDIFAPYRFHMFNLSVELAQRGKLGRLFTVMPKAQVPRTVRPLARCRSSRAIARQALRKFGLDRFPVITRAVIRDFDDWATGYAETFGPVVIGHSGFATLALQAARQSGRRVVCDRGSWHILEQKAVLEDEYEAWGLRRSDVPFDPWVVDRELAEYSFADRISVPSTAARRSFERQGVPAARLFLNPYGADLSRFKPARPDEPRDLRKVVCVANPGLQKGHPYLVAAYTSARGRGTSLELIGERQRSVAHLGELFKADDIHEVGRQPPDDVAVRLRRAGIFVLASVHEGLAMVILEAMASGLPVIATEATGAADVVQHGITGFVVPSRDPDAIAECLTRLLDSPALTCEMGQAAASYVQTLGGWAAYGNRAASLVDQLGALDRQ